MKTTITRWLAAAGMSLAAVVHILIAPEHLQHAPAHGLFFAGLGLAQLAWSGLWIWRPGKKIMWLGIVLSGGMLVLWLSTQWIAVPFATAPEPIDWATIISKLAEGITLCALFAWHIQYEYDFRLGNRLAWGAGQTMGLSLVSGLLILGSGLVATPYLPTLDHQADAEHDHNDGLHSHATPAAAPSAAEIAASHYPWTLPRGFPLPTIPPENSISPEKAELGRYLFYDTRLSGNQTQACAACHIQTLAFTDGRSTPNGSTGAVHPRNAQTLTNVAYNSSYTWANPLLISLERQIPVPMFGETPVELGVTGHEEEVLARFRNDETYQTLFALAYPDEQEAVTWQNIVNALASFVRTLISGNSAYDRFVAGDSTALSASAQRGMSLFFSEALECHHCHTGFNFSASTTWQGSSFVERPFFNTGLYNIDGEGAYPAGNTGVHEVSNRGDDMGRFRPPTLRNIALTAPYMHDGSVGSLEEVIQIYADGGRHIATGEYVGDGRVNPYKNGLVPGFEISEQETIDLLAFLLSLTDVEFIYDPRFSSPFPATE